ncbi:hypothetical protein [Rhizobium sp. Leaf262]|nr:hypothetical protein [Rhizobium sp. Leaf262]
MKLNYDAFKPIPETPKVKRIRKKKPEIYWDAFKFEPPKTGKKGKK